MKSLFYIISFFLVFSALVFASPATDYSFIREFGTSGEQSNQFSSIDGVAVDRFGNIFVSDTSLLEAGWTGEFQVVKKWTTEGNYQLMWANIAGLQGPARGIDCSCDGDPFYIAPKEMTRWKAEGANIEHTSPDGLFYEDFPQENEIFDYPFTYRDVTVSGDGPVYGIVHLDNIADTYMVTKFVWSGSNWIVDAIVTVSNEFELSEQAWAIEADPWRGRVYVTVLASKMGLAGVKVYDMDLNLIDNLYPWNYDALPYGIAVDNRDGSIFVSEGTSNQIQKFSASGIPITSWGNLGSADSEFNRPSDVDVDMNGWVYVADADNHRVQVFAPPMEGNLNFIVQKSKTIVKWKTKLKGKNRDVIMVKGWGAVDHLTNTFGGPGTLAMVGLPMSFWYGEVPIIDNMLPTKTNKKGSKALYKPDKEHKVKLIYKEKGAIIKFIAKLKKGDVNESLGIMDNATLPQWLWVKHR